MIYYSNGCSHTVDVGLQTPSYVDIVADVLIGKGLYETIYLDLELENTPFSEPYLDTISKSTSENIVVKQAKSSKSNDLIFFETVRFVHEMVSIGYKIDYITIQLSGSNRRFYFTSDEKIIHITPHDNIEYGVKFEPLASEQTLQYTILLQNLFEKYNINYCFVPFMEVDSKIYNNTFYKNFLNKEKFTTDIECGHRDEFRKNGFARDEHGHPNCIGYYELALKILNILKPNYVVGDIEEYYSSSDFHLISLTNQSFIQKNYKKLGDATQSIIDKLSKFI